MFEQIKNEQGNRFYKLEESAISKAQTDLGIILPKALTEFYKTVGYGFLKSERSNFNRIMDPASVCEFRFREGQFEYASDLDLYEDDERDKLVFFEVCEGSYLSIGFTKKNNGMIFDGEKIIAKDLDEFFTRYQKDECYYL